MYASMVNRSLGKVYKKIYLSKLGGCADVLVMKPIEHICEVFCLQMPNRSCSEPIRCVCARISAIMFALLSMLSAASSATAATYYWSGRNGGGQPTFSKTGQQARLRIVTELAQVFPERVIPSYLIRIVIIPQ